MISAPRGCPRPCEFAGRAADFPSTGSYAPVLAKQFSLIDTIEGGPGQDAAELRSDVTTSGLLLPFPTLGVEFEK